MGIISIRFITEEDVKRYIKLEQKGKLGPKQAERLEQWRQSNGNPPINQFGNILIRQEVDRIQVQLAERKFYNALADWHNYHPSSSSPTVLMQSQSFLDMVALGKYAIPWILREIDRDWEGYPLFLVLKTIVGYVPAPPEDYGDSEKLKVHWLAWGEEHGYQSPAPPTIQGERALDKERKQLKNEMEDDTE